MAQPRGHLTCDLPVIGIGSVPGWLLCDLHPIGTSTSSPDPQDEALPARRGPYLLPCLFVIAVLLARREYDDNCLNRNSKGIRREVVLLRNVPYVNSKYSLSM